MERIAERFVRFELVLEGEPQNVGIMAGLEATGICPDKAEELMAHFNLNLHTPEYDCNWDWTSFEYPGCYFTEAGYQRHKPHIDRLIEAIRSLENGWDVECKIRYPLKADVYYGDSDQIILRTRYEDELATA